MGSIVNPSPAITPIEKQRLGYRGLSLSNWGNYSIPQIIGNVEVAGSLYSFSVLEDIANWSGVSAGAVFVKLVPAIDGTITARWTSVIPSWSAVKCGWYSPTSGEENQRYVFSAIKKDATNVYFKKEMDTVDFLAPHGAKEFYTDGSWVVPDGVTLIYITGIGYGGAGGAGYAAGPYKGGGGGEGEYAYKIPYLVTPGVTLPIKINPLETSFGSSPNIFVLNNGEAGYDADYTQHGAGGSGGAKGMGTRAGYNGLSGSTSRVMTVGGKGGGYRGFGQGGNGGGIYFSGSTPLADPGDYAHPGHFLIEW